MNIIPPLPRLSIVLAGLVLAYGGNALAQEHSQHVPPQETAEETAKPDDTEMDHAAMGHGVVDDVEPEPATTDHQAMDHARMEPAESPAAAPLTPVPPITASDRAAAFPELQHGMHHGHGINYYVLFDRLEAWDADHGTGQAWDADAWIGGDINRLWLRSEGEREAGRTESADIEVLYGRGITAWWDLLAGVRHDFKPGASQSFAAIGLQGLTSYGFEVEATGYIGQSGQTALRLAVERDTLLTNRLILQWQAEADVYGKDDAQRGIGSGLATVDAGLRLRYEVTRQFAPYIGIVGERAFNGTADLRRMRGEDTDDLRVVAGIRIWL